KSLQNLWWAAGYNLAAIPIAAGALAWAGVSMPPAVAAVLMSVSTIVVAANAQLLRRVALTLTGELDVAAGRRHHPHPERRGRTGRAARLAPGCATAPSPRLAHPAPARGIHRATAHCTQEGT
ncbi:MAG TPA: hypothetical protein VGR26_11585, partial [Acidimicrobiales bacterium]|nr:hypothetical protein [Acidimicrobiales bacterium]